MLLLLLLPLPLLLLLPLLSLPPLFRTTTTDCARFRARPPRRRPGGEKEKGVDEVDANDSDVRLGKEGEQDFIRAAIIFSDRASSSHGSTARAQKKESETGVTSYRVRDFVHLLFVTVRERVCVCVPGRRI